MDICKECGKQEEIAKGRVCKECINLKNRIRSQSEEAKAKRKAYEHRPEIVKRRRSRAEDPEMKKKQLAAQHRYNRTEHGKAMNRIRQSRMGLQWKTECFQAYGGSECIWCGDKYFNGLTIDHINNDGAKHRRKMRKNGRCVDGHGLYLWLRRRRFPEGYQVLCRTCNWVKHVNAGILPVELKDRLRSKDTMSAPSNEYVDVNPI